MKPSNTSLAILLCTLFAFSQAPRLSGQVNQFNYTLRWENGIPTKNVRDIIPGTYNGATTTMSNRIGASSWHAGLAFTAMGISSHQWTAPYMTQQINEPAASWSLSTTLWQTNMYVHYDIQKGSGRFLPYVEAGTGPTWLLTNSYISAKNAQDPSLILDLQDKVIANDFTWNVTGGAGTLIRLGKTEHCCQTGWTDVYLDLYAGASRSLTDVRHFYADDMQHLKTPLQYVNLRAGLTFRINTKKDAQHKPDCCTSCCCNH